MHNKITFSIALLLLLGKVTFAQNVWFLKNDRRLVNNKDSADYIRIISAPDSGDVLYNITELYTDNKKKLIGKSLSEKAFIPQGKILTYYYNGKIQNIIEFSNGKISGDFYEYFPNGKLYTYRYFTTPTEYTDRNNLKFINNYKLEICNDVDGTVLANDGFGLYKVYTEQFDGLLEAGLVKNGKRHGDWNGIDTALNVNYTEKYEDGLFISGTSYDNLGIKHTYATQDLVQPEYAGGYEAFTKYLQQNLLSSAKSKKNKTKGRVFVEFTVDLSGRVDSVRTLRSPDEYLSAEAERLIFDAQGWKPASERGVYRKVKLTVPIDFGPERLKFIGRPIDPKVPNDWFSSRVSY
ncbi:TonB family protein [Mucilaginibacter sp. UR6-1]|uniref:TonB family protein n=1 Tax=Mucilaginibacter sp. UR6-1 TaxID=1435643 RepID=UPI001E4529CD|nr:TonB family protein [Mucilaginibacter sp. UR6-1]MCC8410556.1 TonB family protein [Mucilaginibacter sp. UR6-1]